MKRFFSQYHLTLGLLVIYGLLLTFIPHVGINACKITAKNALEMLAVFPPVFMILGLFDGWVPKETMMNLLGKDSGIRGILMAFAVGSIGAGPLYAAVPIVGVMLKKGNSLANTIVIMGAWTTTKFTLILFEMTALGWRFTLLRFLRDIPAVLLIAAMTTRALNARELAAVYQQATTLLPRFSRDYGEKWRGNHT